MYPYVKKNINKTGTNRSKIFNSKHFCHTFCPRILLFTYSTKNLYCDICTLQSIRGFPNAIGCEWRAWVQEFSQEVFKLNKDKLDMSKTGDGKRQIVQTDRQTEKKDRQTFGKIFRRPIPEIMTFSNFWCRIPL